MKSKKIRDLKKDFNKNREVESIFYRLIFVGPPNVGKTQIINIYNQKRFIDKYEPTFCADFQIGQIALNNKRITVYCIDTQGGIDIAEVTGKSFLKNADAFILVYDITIINSLYSMPILYEKYKPEIINNNIEQRYSEKILYFVGNKCDLTDQIAVKKEEIDEANHKLEVAEANYDLETAARLRHGLIPKLSLELEELNKRNKSDILSDTVDEEDIAKIISKWTSIPISKLVGSEKDKLFNLDNNMNLIHNNESNEFDANKNSNINSYDGKIMENIIRNNDKDKKEYMIPFYLINRSEFFFNILSYATNEKAKRRINNNSNNNNINESKKKINKYNEK